jgi:hypothetical protein
MDMSIVIEYALKPVIAALTRIADGSDAIEDLRAVIGSDIASGLDGLSEAHPEIDRAVFAEVIRWMYKLTLEQIEIIEQIVPGRNPPEKMVRMAVDSLNHLIETPAYR